MTETLIQVTSPYFCAGIVLQKNTVTVAAPIIKYMKGWSLHKVENYCANKRWKVIVVKE